MSWIKELEEEVKLKTRQKERDAALKKEQLGLAYVEIKMLIRDLNKRYPDILQRYVSFDHDVIKVYTRSIFLFKVTDFTVEFSSERAYVLKVFTWTPGWGYGNKGLFCSDVSKLMREIVWYYASRYSEGFKE